MKRHALGLRNQRPLACGFTLVLLVLLVSRVRHRGLHCRVVRANVRRAMPRLEATSGRVIDTLVAGRRLLG